LERDLGDQPAAGTDDQRAEPALPQLPAPDEPAAVPERFQARIEELTQERDQARRELDQALQNLELARCVERLDQTTPAAARSASNNAMR
jgi:hypothetical protein